MNWEGSYCCWCCSRFCRRSFLHSRKGLVGDSSKNCCKCRSKLCLHCCIWAFVVVVVVATFEYHNPSSRSCSCRVGLARG